MRTLAVADLTSERFAPYGEVFRPADTTVRLDRVAHIQNHRPGAAPNLFFARTGIAALPHRFERMEQHPQSSQSFLPFADAPILIATALPGPDGRPDPATLAAFLGRGLGFSYRAGVWHLPAASLGTTVPLAGFMYEDGSPADCVWAEMDPVTLVEDVAGAQSLARSM